MPRGDGEATFDVDGTTWRLRFDFNALLDFERALKAETADADLREVLGRAETGKLTIAETRLLFWAMLQEHHPEATVRVAGRLVIAGMQAMNRAMAAAADDAAPRRVGPDAAGKPKPRRRVPTGH
jgi:hypothetical protein